MRLLLTAVQYFTRIRVPAWVGHAPGQLTGAVRYFPAIGLIVGASGAAVMWLAALVLPAPLPAILGTAVTILMTGAIHEDGLADTSDGTLLWSHTSRASVANLFALQEEMTQRVVDSLALPMTIGEERQLHRDHPATSRAYARSSSRSAACE